MREVGEQKILKVHKGIILAIVAGAVSAFVLWLFGDLLSYSGNDVLTADQYLNTQLLSISASTTFLVIYFTRTRNLSGKEFRICFVLGILLLLYLGIRYTTVAQEKHQVLLKFQEFRQARRDRNYQRAYAMMSPQWQQSHVVDDVKIDSAGFISLEPV